MALAPRFDIPRKKEIFGYTERETPWHYKITAFDYFTGMPKYREMIEYIVNRAKKMGMTQTGFINLWCEKTGAKRSYVNGILKGRKMIELWEYIAVCKMLNIELNMEAFDFDRFSSERQESSKGAVIFIRSLGLIRFTLAFPIDDVMDFKLEFDAVQLVKAGKMKYMSEVLKSLKWYYLEEAGLKQLPFKLLVFKHTFSIKWETNKIIFHKKQK